MQDESYKYWAFISYSHRDQAWAEWLHRALETYRVPRRLLGRDSAAGPLPRRLFPVFRDQEELPSSPNLSAAIDQALRQSRYLIVIASPYAAVSKWVDQEIARFRSLGRGDRILCLIVDGEPHADLQPNKGYLECFPPTLRAIEGVEPIGADVRPGKDGKAAARLKLIAGLLGVGLDELRRRERRRRLLQNLSWAAAGVLIVAMVISVWIVQQREKREALAQQALQAHIRTVYEKGRQELVANNQARAAVFLNEAYRLGVDTPALRFMLGQAMHIVEAQRLSFQTGYPVQDIHVSPDSKSLVTLGFDGVARVWDAASGDKRFEFPVPPYGSYTSPRFSRDSHLLYYQHVPYGAAEGSFSVWDAASGKRLINRSTQPNIDRAFNPFDHDGRLAVYVDPHHDVQVVELAQDRTLRTIHGDYYAVAGFSRDGQRLLTGTDAGEVAVWDHDATRKLRTMTGLDHHIYEIDDSEDGALISASARDGAIRVWRESDGGLRLVAGHPSPNPTVIFNMDGTRLLTNANDGSRIWNTRSGQLEYAWQSAGAAGTKFDISSYGRWAIVANAGRLAVQDIQSGYELYTLDAHQGESSARDISEDDRMIATGGDDGRVVLWNVPDIPDFEMRHEVDPIRWAAEVNQPAVAAAFNHAGTLVATGGGDGSLKLWDAATHKLVRSIQADARDVDALAFSEDDGFIVTGGYSDGIKIWDARSGALVRELGTEGRRVLWTSVNRDGSVIAAAIQGGLTRLWAAGSGEVLTSFDRDQARAGAFSPDGKTYAIGTKGQVRLWDIADRRFVWSTPQKDANGGVGAVAFSRDGARILVASYGHSALVLDAHDGTVAAQIEAPRAYKFNSANFSADGEAAVLGEENGGAFLWWPRTDRSLPLAGHTGGMKTAAFSPDGLFVMTSGRDASAKLWDVQTGELLGTIAEQPGQFPQVPAEAASFSPDGRRALTGSIDGDFRLWELRDETRSSAQIASILKCRVPWQLDGDVLRSVAPQATDCPR